MKAKGILNAVLGALPGIWGWVNSPKFLTGVLLGFFALLLILRRLRQGASLTLGLPFNLGSATITPSHADRIAAWKLYVQLKTRKAAITFDDENDVVVEPRTRRRT